MPDAIFNTIMEYTPRSVFKDAAAVRDFFRPLREQGKTIVTTNGCFDLLHIGHVNYLTEASQLGDILIIGVNSDATVQKLKGPGRPVQNQENRVKIMSALKMVDGAFIFFEDDPRPFLEIIQPDIHVKGGDYTPDIIERETVEKHGGKIAIVSFVNGYSTTSIVKKLRSS